ncbi:MAG: glycosyltransferase family 39 protein, partial [Acidobacteriota bacterium]
MALVYRLTRRIASREAALLAAATIGVSFLHVRDSHFATNDVLMVTLVVAAVLQAVRYLDRPSAGNLFIAGALAGAAAGAKYNGAIATASVAVALVVVTTVRQRRPALLVYGGAVCAVGTFVGFAASNPAVLLAPRHVLNGFLQASALDRAAFCCQSSRAVPLQMADATVLGIGACAVLAAIWGVVVALRTRPRAA